MFAGLMSPYDLDVFLLLPLPGASRGAGAQAKKQK